MPPQRSQGPGGPELLSLGLFLAIAVVGPMLVGIALDRTLGSGPAFLLLGLAVGAAGAAATVYLRYVRRYM